MLRKKGKSPHEELYGYEAKFVKNLRIFGEIGVKLSKLYGLPEKLPTKAIIASSLDMKVIIHMILSGFLISRKDQ